MSGHRLLNTRFTSTADCLLISQTFIKVSSETVTKIGFEGWQAKALICLLWAYNSSTQCGSSVVKILTRPLERPTIKRLEWEPRSNTSTLNVTDSSFLRYNSLIESPIGFHSCSDFGSKNKQEPSPLPTHRVLLLGQPTIELIPFSNPYV